MTHFETQTALIEQKVGSVNNIKRVFLTVKWYYGAIECTIKLTKPQWKQIISGKPFYKKGDNYMAEDGVHPSYWHFNEDEPGSLEVDYEDGGQGFIGSLDEATIEVEGVRDESNRRSVDDVRSPKANSPRRSRRSHAQASKPAPTTSSAPTPSEPTKTSSTPWQPPEWAKDRTSERSGETLTIIGAPRPTPTTGSGSSGRKGTRR